MHRREFLQASTAAALCGLALPQIAGARPPRKKIVFLFARGGWDPTRVFVPALDHPRVAREPGAVARTLGDLRFVDHPARPSVASFFARHRERVLVVNGVETRALRHDVCTRLCLTGDSAAAQPDWSTRLASCRISCDARDISGDWDTHTDNDRRQSASFEALFAELGRVIEAEAEETVLCVCSEMGRTPSLNPQGGKDHWPTTSWMLVGPGITGGRTVGGVGDGFRGLGVDSATAEVAEGAPRVTPAVLGATLLALADIDPEAHLPGVGPLLGVLG